MGRETEFLVLEIVYLLEAEVVQAPEIDVSRKTTSWDELLLLLLGTGW